MFATNSGKFATAFLLATLAVLLFTFPKASASNRTRAAYGAESDRLFWFIHTSDTHIGASGSTDADRLRWLVTTAKNVIQPSFIVVTGDLTDCTNGNFLGYPNGPYQTEWTEYSTILSAAGMTPDFYYDVPGNHDAYNDKNFYYYLRNSVQGKATGRTQASWTRSFTFGNYRFIGVNTAGNTGSKFSLSPPYGDYPGLDSTELAFISAELETYANSDLTMIFGHHPLAYTGNSQDTYLGYGLTDFESKLQTFKVPFYGYGHTHVFDEQFFTENLNPGIFYFDVASLGKSSANQYTVIAVDHNGLSTITPSAGSWPVVLITAPLDRNLGGVINPYGYDVTAVADNPVRALVFDPALRSVQFRVDGSATWLPMTQQSGPVYQGVWDASRAPQGEHTIEVQATNTSNATRNNIITVWVSSGTTTPVASASISSVGKYVSGAYQITSTFNRGNGVVARARVTSSSSGVSGTTVQFSVTTLAGSPVTTMSGITSSTGETEAKWQTTAPNKKGAGGTAKGDYWINLESVSAQGYTWDGVTSSVKITLQ